MFESAETHTYKIVATWTSGKKATFNYITSVIATEGAYILHGQEQTDGTMEQRSFVLERKVVAFLDVRKISTRRQVELNKALANSMAPAQEREYPSDGEVAF